MNKAILFDLDGTLLDTLADLADSMNSVLRALGHPPHPTDDYRYFIGDGLTNLVRRALPERNRNADEVAAAEQRMRRQYAVHWADSTRPYPGIPELLAELKQRRLPLAVFSNKPHDATQRCVRRFFEDGLFDPVLGAREGVPRKPDPTVPLEIAEQLRVPRAEFLYLGDTGTDMTTACAAGMFPVGVLWGFRTEQELRENGAQTVIGQPDGLLKLL